MFLKDSAVTVRRETSLKASKSFLKCQDPINISYLIFLEYFSIIFKKMSIFDIPWYLLAMFSFYIEKLFLFSVFKEFEGIVGEETLSLYCVPYTTTPA